LENKMPARVELTHLPLEVIPSLVSKARKLGAKVVVGHGETVCEPVIKGTNKTFINAGVDILAHPGNITDDDVKLAVKKRVCLELTTRHGHDATNKHVLEAARRFGAKLVIDNDAHQPKDLLTLEERNLYISNLNISADELRAIELNSVKLIKSRFFVQVY
jgi:histidinol phosphatase-like PHP family hydrolase